VRLHELRKESAGEFSSLITVATSFNNSGVSVAGTVVANAPKIVKIDGFDVEATPEGYLLVCHNDDRPGIMGHIGTILGKASVNIASMTLGRREKGGPAITVLNLDQEISEQTINEIGKFSGIRSTRLVKL
jgi:D-3-phosphoglycerate dehydrogenase